MESVGGVALDFGKLCARHLGKRVSRPEIQGAVDARFGKNLKGCGPIDWGCDLGSQLRRCRRCCDDAFAVAAGQQQATGYRPSRCLGCQRRAKGATAVAR